MIRFDRPGKIAIIFFAECAANLAKTLQTQIPDSSLWTTKALQQSLVSKELLANEGLQSYETDLASFTGTLWKTHAALLFIGASGIAVRAIAPWVASKYSDPAILVIDDVGRFVISLLSGHEGKANSLTEQISEAIGAQPVITTGSEAARRLVVGIGCRRGTSATTILEALDTSLAMQNLDRTAIYALATIELKANEPGLLQAAQELNVPIRIIPLEKIRAMQEALREHTFVEEITGVAAVCVPAALFASPHSRILIPKIARNGVTVAVAEDVFGWSASAQVDTSI